MNADCIQLSDKLAKQMHLIEARYENISLDDELAKSTAKHKKIMQDLDLRSRIHGENVLNFDKKLLLYKIHFQNTQEIVRKSDKRLQRTVAEISSMTEQQLKLKTESVLLIEKKDLLHKRLLKFKPFQEYLKSSMALFPGFVDCMQILDRYRSLITTRQELNDSLVKSWDEIVAIKEEINLLTRNHMDKKLEFYSEKLRLECCLKECKQAAFDNREDYNRRSEKECEKSMNKSLIIRSITNIYEMTNKFRKLKNLDATTDNWDTSGEWLQKKKLDIIEESFKIFEKISDQ